MSAEEAALVWSVKPDSKFVEYQLQWVRGGS
jgi:hypothetical protein